MCFDFLYKFFFKYIAFQEEFSATLSLNSRNNIEYIEYIIKYIEYIIIL